MNLISEILCIEKEPASRRLSGKVLFTIREMGLLADVFTISIDQLRSEDDQLWMPLGLNSPMQKVPSIEALSGLIETNFGHMVKMGEQGAESGNIYTSIPIEFYIPYPTLLKFMFFKWGHYFIGTEAYDHFSRWQLPVRMLNLHDKFKQIKNYSQVFYIWDNSLIWSLVGEIEFFHNMHVITTEERDAIRDELKELLFGLEEYLKGQGSWETAWCEHMQFYISNLSMGFTCSNAASTDYSMTVFQTNFTFSQIRNSQEAYHKVKEWMKSLQSMSVQISQSARVERRLFFEKQHRVIDTLLH
ncbi:MAG: hypothetical protein LIP04_14890 [Tannerellaceae bacterium]|nr:hypothetical protein [Tannerellaceae bacterium]